LVEKDNKDIAKYLLEVLEKKAKNAVKNQYYNKEINKEECNQLVEKINEELILCKEAITLGEINLGDKLKKYSERKVSLTIKGVTRKIIIEFFEACGKLIESITKSNKEKIYKEELQQEEYEEKEQDTKEKSEKLEKDNRMKLENLEKEPDNKISSGIQVNL